MRRSAENVPNLLLISNSSIRKKSFQIWKKFFDSGLRVNMALSRIIILLEFLIFFS